MNPQEANSAEPAENGASTPNTEKKAEAGSSDKGTAEGGGSPAELPLEVRVKLRKFDRLESTYTGQLDCSPGALRH